MFSVLNEDGITYDPMGCCVLEEAREANVLRLYNDYFAPEGLQATKYLPADKIESDYKTLIPEDSSTGTSTVPLNNENEYKEYYDEVLLSEVYP